jgi:hypothetical protein
MMDCTVDAYSQRPVSQSVIHTSDRWQHQLVSGWAAHWAEQSEQHCRSEGFAYGMFPLATVGRGCGGCQSQSGMWMSRSLSL